MSKNKFKKGATLYENSILKFDLINKNDLQRVTNLRNIFRKNFFDNRKLTLEDSAKWFEKLDIPKESLLVIRLKKNNLMIGVVGWSNWDYKNKTAEFGKLIIDYRTILKFFNKNEITDLPISIIKSTIDFGFNEMGLNRIYTKTKKTNFNSIEIQKRIGLKIECVDKFYLLSITKTEWKKK